MFSGVIVQKMGMAPFSVSVCVHVFIAVLRLFRVVSSLPTYIRSLYLCVSVYSDVSVVMSFEPPMM